MYQRILVVDDDKSIVRVLTAYLEQAGYLVIPAYDGEMALYAMRRERPDLAILDESSQLPEIIVDPIRIRQVLFNLLTNALRHTQRGERVIIRSELSSSELIISVWDDGEGMSSEQLAVVFERFYRGDKSRNRETGGTGLGLAIVKAIVEAHNGKAEAFSEGKGKGSQFRIILPR